MQHETNDTGIMLENIIKFQEENLNTDGSVYKKAILTHFLKDIREDICILSEKIKDVYNTIIEYENSTGDVNNDLYKTLYEKKLNEKADETAFLNTFTPYMTIWNLMSGGILDG